MCALRLGVYLFVGLAMTTLVGAEDTSLFPICVEGKYGYIDNKGNVTIKPQFLEANYFSEGLALVTVAGTTEEDLAFERKYQGFIKPDGTFAIPPEPPNGVSEMPEYQMTGYSFCDFHDGVARFHVGDMSGVYGFLDRKGNVVIEPAFSEASDFSDGLAFASLRVPQLDAFSLPEESSEGHAVGFINKLGEFVIKRDVPFYSHGFVDGRALCITYSGVGFGNYSLIDRRERILVPEGKYVLGQPVSEAIRAVKDGEVGLLNSDGEILVEFGKYDQIFEPDEGSVFLAELGMKKFLIDSNGDQLTEVTEQGDIGRFREGMATIKRNGRVGFIDSSGEVKIPLRFDFARQFRNGLALVRWGNTFGYIDRQGQVVWKSDR